MAIAGNNTWIPSNRIKVVNKEIAWLGSITQNKPRTIVCRDVGEAVRLLISGESVTVDVREEFFRELRVALAAAIAEAEAAEAERIRLKKYEIIIYAP